MLFRHGPKLGLTGAIAAIATLVIPCGQVTGERAPLQMDRGYVHHCGVGASPRVNELAQPRRATNSSITVEVVDAESGLPLEARVGVFDNNRVPFPPADQPATMYQGLAGKSYFYPDGPTVVPVTSGGVEIYAGRGLEYVPQLVGLQVSSDQTVELALQHHTDMNALGWYAGDTHVHISHLPIIYSISSAQAVRMMRAEGLNFANAMEEEPYFTGAIDPQSDANHVLYFSKEQRNPHFGHLSIVGLKNWIPNQSCGVVPTACGKTLNQAIYQQVHDQGGNSLVIATHTVPTENWFDVSPWPGGGVWRGGPMDLAAGSIDAIDLLSYSDNNLDQVVAEYEHMLNLGFRTPITAGTDCGLSSTHSYPMGGVRVYAQLPPGVSFSMDAWVDAVKAGRTFVTNYPLIESFTLAGAGPGEVLPEPGSPGRPDDNHLGSKNERLKGQFKVSCVVPMGKVQLVSNLGVLREWDVSNRPAPLRVARQFNVSSSGLTWVALRVIGPVGGWHPIDVDGELFAQTNPVFFDVSARYVSRQDELPAFYSVPRRAAAEYFKNRLKDVDVVFANALFPGDSRAVFDDAFNSATEWVEQAVEDAPESFDLVGPTEISYAHGRPAVFTSTPRFSWSVSEDPDAGDRVRYYLWLQRKTNLNDIRRYGPVDGTEFTIPAEDALHDGDVWLWGVEAVDITSRRSASTPQVSEVEVDLNPVGIPAAGPQAWALSDPIPNPFNPQTSLGYVVPAGAGRHQLTVYDASGRKVRELFSGTREAGHYLERWDGRNDRGTPVATAVYFIRLSGDGFVPRTVKAVLVK